MISAIETTYDGYRFRSRMEARYAVTFNCLGIDYHYEPEGFSIHDRAYLADFWLPELETFVEVKPPFRVNQALFTLKSLANFTAKTVWVLFDPPGIASEAAFIEPGQRLRRLNLGCLIHSQTGILLEDIDRSLAQGRDARFEHGETPPVMPPTPNFGMPSAAHIDLPSAGYSPG